MEKAHSSWRSVLTPTLSSEREQHLDVLSKCGVRVLGRREEPDTGKLRPRKQTSGTPCEWEGWRYGGIRILDRQTSPRT